MARIYWAASVGHRYGDACQTFVKLDKLSNRIVGESGERSAVEDAAERAAEYEREYIQSTMDDDGGDNLAYTVADDVVTYGGFTHRPQDLFTAAELAEHRHDLARGEIIVLYH